MPTDPVSLGELMEQLPAGDGAGRDFSDLRAVAIGLYSPDEEIAEHLPATRSPRFHTTAAGAALVWTERGRELDPETADGALSPVQRDRSERSPASPLGQDGLDWPRSPAQDQPGLALGVSIPASALMSEIVGGGCRTTGWERGRSGAACEGEEVAWDEVR